MAAGTAASARCLTEMPADTRVVAGEYGGHRNAPTMAMVAVLSPGKPPGSLREGGEGMYEQPKLERFGTFRELTLVGTGAFTDFLVGDHEAPGHS